MERFGKKSMKAMAVSIYAGWILTYLFGTLWYCFITGTGFVAALLVCVLPFLAGDCLKTVLSISLIKKLYPVMR